MGVHEGKRGRQLHTACLPDEDDGDDANASTRARAARVAASRMASEPSMCARPDEAGRMSCVRNGEQLAASVSSLCDRTDVDLDVHERRRAWLV